MEGERPTEAGQTTEEPHPTKTGEVRIVKQILSQEELDALPGDAPPQGLSDLFQRDMRHERGLSVRSGGKAGKTVSIRMGFQHLKVQPETQNAPEPPWGRRLAGRKFPVPFHEKARAI